MTAPFRGLADTMSNRSSGFWADTVDGITLKGGCRRLLPGADLTVGKTQQQPGTRPREIRNIGMTASEPRKRLSSRSGDCQPAWWFLPGTGIKGAARGAIPGRPHHAVAPRREWS